MFQLQQCVMTQLWQRMDGKRCFATGNAQAGSTGRRRPDEASARKLLGRLVLQQKLEAQPSPGDLFKPSRAPGLPHTSGSQAGICAACSSGCLHQPCIMHHLDRTRCMCIYMLCRTTDCLGAELALGGSPHFPRFAAMQSPEAGPQPPSMDRDAALVQFKASTGQQLESTFPAACSQIPTSAAQPTQQQARPPRVERGCGRHCSPGNMQLITNSGTGGGPAAVSAPALSRALSACSSGKALAMMLLSVTDTGSSSET